MADPSGAAKRLGCTSGYWRRWALLQLFPMAFAARTSLVWGIVPQRRLVMDGYGHVPQGSGHGCCNVPAGYVPRHGGATLPCRACCCYEPSSRQHERHSSASDWSRCWPAAGCLNHWHALAEDCYKQLMILQAAMLATCQRLLAG
jgi:hypothetical protein